VGDGIAAMDAHTDWIKPYLPKHIKDWPPAACLIDYQAGITFQRGISHHFCDPIYNRRIWLASDTLKVLDVVGALFPVAFTLWLQPLQDGYSCVVIGLSQIQT
jgi:hypothetical protein